VSFLIGLLAGLFGGLVGLGGGVIIITLMVRLYSFSQHQAHGTSLMAMVFTGLAGAITYYLNGSVDFLAAALLATSAIFTARFGALYAHALPGWRLKRAFGIFLLCVSIFLLIKPYLSHLAFLSHAVAGWHKVTVLLASGALAGFISGMMGVGGGSIMVPALVLLVGDSQYTAQGSALLAMVPACAAGAYTHWRLGNVITRVLPAMIPGILIGTYGGASLAHFLTEAILRLIFATVLIWMGIRDIRAARKLKDTLTTGPLKA
jgi:uncharacterized membrane protein YfcA